MLYLYQQITKPRIARHLGSAHGVLFKVCLPVIVFVHSFGADRGKETGVVRVNGRGKGFAKCSRSMPFDGLNAGCYAPSAYLQRRLELALYTLGVKEVSCWRTYEVSRHGKIK